MLQAIRKPNLGRTRRLRWRDATAEEGRARFDDEAQRTLGMTGEEFVRAWEAGEFGDDPDDWPAVMSMAFSLHWYGVVADYGSKRVQRENAAASPLVGVLQLRGSQEEAAMILTERPPKTVGRTRKPRSIALSREEGRTMFDQEARRWLGMSGEAFVAAWESGKFDDDPERREVMQLVSLLPFYQDVPVRE